MKSLAVLLSLVAVLLLAGCPAAIIGGGAVAYGTIEDRRTSGTMIDDDSIETRISRGVRERYGENTHVNVTSFNRSVLLGESRDAEKHPEEKQRKSIRRTHRGSI